MNPTPDSSAYVMVPLGLIDEPANPARETMEEKELAELAESIDDHGLIQPLTVERTGERYRVIAGHRRLLACQILHLEQVPCIVRDSSDVDAAAVTLAENAFREDLNPAEEAQFLDTLLHEKCGGDVDKLVRLVRRRREYVEDRLLLLRGDRAVLDALAQRKVPLGVARELNRVKDEGQRFLYLDSAIRGGATTSVVRNWRAQGEAVEQQLAAADPAVNFSTAGKPAVQPAQMTCLFCAETDEPQMMEVVFLHRQCRKFLGRVLDRSQIGAAEPE